jgi:3',5'-cyclic-AMP phosphodiesterase
MPSAAACLAWVGQVCIVGACGVQIGCTRPGEERAQQDREVGRAEIETLEVEVTDGLAVVRALDAASLSLWASAPRLELTLRFRATPPETLWLEIDNCMPGSLLDTGGVPLQESGREAKRCFFRVGPFAGTDPVQLRLAAPGTESANPFRFAVMSDVQEAINTVGDIYEVVNGEPGLDFLLSAGDLTEFGTGTELEQFATELEGLDIPFYTTLGNHELRESVCLFQNYFGRGSSSFEYRGARFTLLDSASATIDPIAQGWLGGWLARGADRLHIVAMHVPPRDPIGLRDVAFASRNEASQLLARLAEGRVDLTLYGHVHSYYHFENAGIPAYISGGGGSHPERFDDIGRHFLVVDADPLAATTSVRVVRVD